MTDVSELRSQDLQAVQGPIVTALKPIGQALKSQTSGGHHQRQGDVMYMSELLSYSLDRLRKVLTRNYLHEDRLCNRLSGFSSVRFVGARSPQG